MATQRNASVGLSPIEEKRVDDEDDVFFVTVNGVGNIMHFQRARCDISSSRDSFSHGHENETPNKSLAVQNPTINETDRLQVTNVNSIPVQRRESFLYRSESDGENSQPPRTSRHSSVSSSDCFNAREQDERVRQSFNAREQDERVRQSHTTDELVTPFAQVLSSLQSIRANFVLLTNTRQNRFRRGSEGFNLNSRLCQLYEISDGSMIRDDMFKKLTMETLKEFDWCLGQLDTLKASMSISEMASNKFKRLLDRELKDCSEAGVGGREISAWVFDTFVDKPMEAVRPRDPRHLRARSKSLVKSLKKLSRSVSCSGSVPRFGVECADELDLEKIMEKVDSWTFDCFKLANYTAGHPLTALTYTLLQTRDLLNQFKIKPWVFTNYMNLVESHYLKEVPFHNSTHAADVVHATHVLLSATVFEGVFNDLEILAAIMASAVHDVDHPGVNNQFLVNSSSEMALMYNDESVLENHHLAVAFQLLQSENCDILDSFSRPERQNYRKMVIEMVLATDNAKHMQILGSLKTMVETKKLSNDGQKTVELESFSEKMHVLKCLVHCADLSNPTRPRQYYEEWVERLMEEFFKQGDIERDRGMEISPMMDRNNPQVEKSQVVFIDYVVHPLWETWADLVYPDAQDIMDNLVTNREHYRKLCPVSPSVTPAVTPKSSPFPARRCLSTENAASAPLLPGSADDVEKSESPPRCESITGTTSCIVKNDIKLFKTTKSTSNILKANSNEDYIDNCTGADGPRRKSDSDALNRATVVVSQAKQKLLRYGHVVSIDNNQQTPPLDDNAHLTNSNNIKNLDQNKNVVELMQDDALRTSSDSTNSESIGGSNTRITSP